MQIDTSEAIFQLNPIQDPELFFPDYLTQYLNRYLAFCNQFGVSSDVLAQITSFKEKIGLCIFEYCYGQHLNATSFFSEALQFVPISKLFRPLDDRVLYRARLPKKKHGFQKSVKFDISEMFHVPFEKRYLVSNQRFSFPGLPCLYFGSSPEVCCLELSSWSNDISIATYKARNDSVCILDLFFFTDYNFYNLSEAETDLFLLSWPLIACCTFRFADADKMTFRQDYIIPQLLLEYIIDQNAQAILDGSHVICDGIRYFSAKRRIIEPGRSREESDAFINYVFPTQVIRSSGNCEKLESLFEPLQVYFKKELC